METEETSAVVKSNKNIMYKIIFIMYVALYYLYAFLSILSC